MYSKEEVNAAYLKFKAHIYYDTADLLQRKQIAQFETNVDESDINLFVKSYSQPSEETLAERLNKIYEALESYHGDGKIFFEELLSEIDIVALPKKFANLRKKRQEPENFLSNRREEKEYDLESTTLFIKLPIELHIISVLWLQKYGYKLDAELDEKCLGNRLILTKDKDKIVRGSGLFKPYFKQYLRWRDKAIEEARNRLDNNEDIALINLDIREYFYSARLNFKDLESHLQVNPLEAINQIFKSIHTIFTRKLASRNLPHDNLENEINNEDTVVLPIGMTSSYVLANWYLVDFDKRVQHKIKPIYYSRYVDDILIVLPNPNFTFSDTEKSDKLKFTLEKYFEQEKEEESLTFLEKKSKNPPTLVERFILETFYPVVKLVDTPSHFLSTEAESKLKKIFKITATPNCYFQGDKTLVYFFDNKDSTTVIDKLKEELEERTSEFRDFPEESTVEKSFDDQAYHFIFDGSEGKIRTLKDFKENRYGLSVFLANRIFASLRQTKSLDKKESSKILSLFRGQNNLEFYRFWEKILTYFIVTNDKPNFIQFYQHTLTQIQRINYKGKSLSSEDIQASLIEYFDAAFELVLSLNPKFLDKEDRYQKQFDQFQKKFSSKITLTTRKPVHGSRYRVSNMVRHYYVTQPLLNYTKAGKDLDLSLIDRNLPDTKYHPHLDLSTHAEKYSPRIVKFYECCIAVATKRILRSDECTKTGEKYRETTILEKDDEREFYLDEAYLLYERINAQHFKNNPEEFEARKKRLFDRKNIPLHESEVLQTPISVNEFRLNTNLVEKKPRVSFANIKLNPSDFINSLRGTPEISSDRYNTIAHLLNESRDQKCDFFVLPECSIPYELVPSLAKYSEHNQMCIIGGLEHWLSKDTSFNFIVTLIPIAINGINDCVVIYRLKNHYSHHEELEVRGNHFHVPKPRTYRYDLFNWRGIYFAPYYCVELANIQHRSIFRSKLDLLVCSEWNKDTPYFSNIVESLSRDLHCFVAQVNNSEYGDSRLTQPAESALRDQLKLKGGINSTILVGEFDHKKLREFQRKTYELTHSDKEYKPIPPDLNIVDVLKRIDNEFVFQKSSEF